MALRGGCKLGLVNSVVSRVNNQILRQNRFVTPEAVRLDAMLRLNSLYPRMLGHRQWWAAFCEIREAKLNGQVMNLAVIPKLNEEGLALLELIKTDCQGKFREAWEALPRAGKASHWQRLTFWLLLNAPDLSLEFLLVTTGGMDKPDFQMLVDCVWYLEKFYYDVLSTWEKGSHTYESVVQTCLDPKTWPILRLPQKGIRLYLRRSGHAAVVSAFKIVCERQIEMTTETALYFMNRFTEFGDIDMALEAFRFALKLKQPGFSLDSLGVMRHCCKLLTLDTVQDGSGGRNFRILPQLLEMGVRPDRDMMNLVLSNAFRTGNPVLGLDMLEFMKSQDYDLDSYTYVALLCDAVDREDRVRVGELVREIEGKGDLRRHKYIASKIFHAHYVFTAKRMDSGAEPSEVFYSMLDMYNELHDITPLKELLIIPPNYTPPSGGANTPPSLVALYIMIATYFRCQKRISLVRQVYERFRTLVMEGHEIIAPLAETDHTYNEFLVAYRDDPRALQYCVELVEDMLQSPPPVGLDSHGKKKVFAHVKPTVRTWTILLSAFTFNRQPLAAEKVKEMMAKQSIKYNQVTWNIIVNGYANAQNVPETAKAIKMMEDQGFPIDEYAMKSLRYLRDPERLWVALEELDEKAAQEASLESTPAPENESEKAWEQLLDKGLRRLEARSKT